MDDHHTKFASGCHGLVTGREIRPQGEGPTAFLAGEGLSARLKLPKPARDKPGRESKRRCRKTGLDWRFLRAANDRWLEDVLGTPGAVAAGACRAAGYVRPR